MNIFFVRSDDTIVTPPLGTILPGITRDAVIRLAREAGYRVEERAYSLDDWRTEAANRSLKEVFVCGTAAVIVSVGVVRTASDEFAVADGKGGPVADRLRDALTTLQRGGGRDPHGWRHAVALTAAA